jgi:SWIM/SEC-C metal-binding protein
VAQLGTHKHPAIVRVNSLSRGEEIVALCHDHGWQVIVGVEPDEPEDISDVEELLSREREREIVRPLRSPPRVAPNDYCPCGSGKKFKKCCSAA